MPDDLTPLEIRQGDFAYQANLELPVFELAGRWAELQHQIYAQLGSLQLRLGDIKVESASANPGDLSVACWLLNYGAVVRYRLDRVEAWSNKPIIGADSNLRIQIVGQAMKVLRNVCPESRVASHAVTVDLHGALPPGQQVAPRIRAYVTRQPNGPIVWTAGGASFLGEWRGGRGSAVLERSATVSDGAFLRVTSEHAGSLVETEALGQAVEFVDAAIEGMGFKIAWGI